MDIGKANVIHSLDRPNSLNEAFPGRVAQPPQSRKRMTSKK